MSKPNPDVSHMIDQDADALMRGERVDATNRGRDYLDAEIMAWAQEAASRPRFRKTDEHGRSFEITGVVDCGEELTGAEFMARLKAGLAKNG